MNENTDYYNYVESDYNDLNEKIASLERKTFTSRIISGVALLIALITIIFLLGQASSINSVHEAVSVIKDDQSTQEKQNVDLVRKIDYLQGNMDDLQGDINDLNWELMWSNKEYEQAYLSTSSLGTYSRIDSNNGILFVSLRDVQPYLNGYKLFLDIGNPNYVEFDGFDLTIEWGEYFHLAERRKITQSFTNNLKAGSWNRVEVVITPAEKDDLDYIRLSIETNVILLLIR